MPEQIFAVDRVSVSFGPRNNRLRALDNVTIRLVPGELTLVMGPSGSGKTTLLSLLGCLLQPDCGSVFIGGKDVTQIKDKEQTRLRSRIGFVFQSFRLFESLSAFENVILPTAFGDRRGRPVEMAQMLLEKVGLGAKQHLKPDALSGGEKQRVAICRALMANPDLVLADEPTASLDCVAGTQIRELLKQISQKQGLTVVVVSHDSRWITYADRVVRLEDGRIVDDRRSGSCEESLSLSHQAVF